MRSNEVRTPVFADACYECFCCVCVRVYVCVCRTLIVAALAVCGRRACAVGVFERLTDVRGFTGAHRHRFTEDGRGRGLAGRDRIEADYEMQRRVMAKNPVPCIIP
jgi:hypothetical protein